MLINDYIIKPVGMNIPVDPFRVRTTGSDEGIFILYYPLIHTYATG